MANLTPQAKEWKGRIQKRLKEVFEFLPKGYAKGVVEEFEGTENEMKIRSVYSIASCDTYNEDVAIRIIEIALENQKKLKKKELKLKKLGI